MLKFTAFIHNREIFSQSFHMIPKLCGRMCYIDPF